MIKSFFASEFRKNIVKLLSANVFSQVIALAIYPLVTRIYSPEEFGAFNVFMGICSVLFVLSTGKYEEAVLLPKADKKAISIVQLALFITIALSLLIGLLILPFKNFILNYFSMESVGDAIYFMPLLIFLYGLGMILCYWYNRLKKFHLISVYLVSQNFTNSIFKILFGWLQFTRLGLIYATFAGYLSSVLSICFAKDKKTVFSFLKPCKRKDIYEVAREYKNYPKYVLPNTFINMLSSNMPFLMMAPYFGEKMIGFYGLALTVGFRPINVISKSIYQAFFQKATELYNDRKSILPLFRQFCIKTFIIFFPLFLVLYLFLTPLTEFLFGFDWTETTHSLRLLMPWIFVNLFSSSMAFFPDIFFKQKKAMQIEACYTICRFLALLWGTFINDFYVAIFLFSGVSTIFSLGKLMWFHLLILQYERSITL